MGPIYGHVDDKRDSGELAAIGERVAELRDLAADGDL
jgi:deoxyribodipyrimidine photolyase-related protein